MYKSLVIFRETNSFSKAKSVVQVIICFFLLLQYISIVIAVFTPKRFLFDISNLSSLNFLEKIFHFIYFRKKECLYLLLYETFYLLLFSMSRFFSFCLFVFLNAMKIFIVYIYLSYCNVYIHLINLLTINLLNKEAMPQFIFND